MTLSNTVEFRISGICSPRADPRMLIKVNRAILRFPSFPEILPKSTSKTARRKIINMNEGKITFISCALGFLTVVKTKIKPGY